MKDAAIEAKVWGEKTMKDLTTRELGHILKKVSSNYKLFLSMLKVIHIITIIFKGEGIVS